MKKTKYYFGLQYWNDVIPKQVSTFQFYLKNIVSIGTITFYINSKPEYSLVLCILGYTLDFLGHFIQTEEV